MTSPWDPGLYERFKAQRDRPGRELLEGLKPLSGCRALDLGCGTGELTARLHGHLGAAETIGIDSSETMLAKSDGREAAGLRFEQRDLREAGGLGRFDVVFSNAVLQWVDDHESLLASVLKLVAPGGRLAFQVPSNHDHPSHRLAREMATEEPWAAKLGGVVRHSPVLTAARYSERLHELGVREPRVELRVYLHELPSPESVFEWVSGTMLTWFQERLTAEDWERFRESYRERLLALLPDSCPYAFSFPRVLAWAQLQ